MNRLVLSRKPRHNMALGNATWLKSGAEFPAGEAGGWK